MTKPRDRCNIDGDATDSQNLPRRVPSGIASPYRTLTSQTRPPKETDL